MFIEPQVSADICSLSLLQGEPQCHSDPVVERGAERRDSTSCDGIGTRLCSISRYIRNNEELLNYSEFETAYFYT